MRFSRLTVIFSFAFSSVFGVERIGMPVSPSLWDSYLPNSAHPSFASNLGALQEGRLTFGFQDLDLAHLSLSVPGLQIINANTKWSTKAQQERWYYDTEHAYFAGDDYYRNFFLVAGGLQIFSLNGWNFGIGGTLKNLSVEDSEGEKFWEAYWLGGSFSVSANSILLSGSWDKYEQRYLLAYYEPGNWQAGIEFYQNLKGNSAFGVQPGGELVFYESLKVHSGMRWQFAESSQNGLLKRVEFMLNFGMSLRFRPWRAEIDPKWIRGFVSPYNAAIFYDWELSFDSTVDAEYGTYNWLISVSRWF
jgi:hypothetical protein